MNEETRLKCRLVTRGTDRANAKVADDLKIPDPNLAIGKQVVDKAMQKEIDDDSQPANSK